MSVLERERAGPGDRELEALIEEARLRRRRRRRHGAAARALAAACGAGVFLASGGGGAIRASFPVRASPGAIRAFLSRASRGSDGLYSMSYTTTVRYPGELRRVEVAVAQRSPLMFTYSERPSIEVSPASYGYEVFVLPGRSRRSGARLYSCRQVRRRSGWSCTGPFTGIGMGGTEALIGAYPPQALVLGLQNAVDMFTGVPAPPATQQEPAFLFNRRLAGRELRCLGFGRFSHLLGSVCLDRNGLIAYYDLPQRMTYGAYDTAILRSYTARVSRDAFTLPATPRGT